MSPRTPLSCSTWSRCAPVRALTASERSAVDATVTRSSSIFASMPSTLDFMRRIVSVATMNLL